MAYRPDPDAVRREAEEAEEKDAERAAGHVYRVLGWVPSSLEPCEGYIYSYKDIRDNWHERQAPDVAFSFTASAPRGRKVRDCIVQRTGRRWTIWWMNAGWVASTREIRNRSDWERA